MLTTQLIHTDHSHTHRVWSVYCLSLGAEMDDRRTMTRPVSDIDTTRAGEECDWTFTFLDI